MYGDGPGGHPFLYQRRDPAKLLTGPTGRDVLRNAEGTAIIGDPRNDSHLLVSQMHLAFARAHNAFVDRVRAAHVAEADLFVAAARELRWHYHHAILAEYLPSLIGERLTDELLADGCRYFHPEKESFIPLEFADAAFRYGHSQIRHQYVLNDPGETFTMFPDLMGFRPIPNERSIDWSFFFDHESSSTAQRAKRIDGRLVRELIELPVALTGECEIEEFHSLAVRDLERGQGVGLPSGEAIARYLGETPLSPREIGVEGSAWDKETPLWYYVLREADVKCAGDGLGPVGGRIVGEVLVGLLDNDKSSVRYAPTEWRPIATLLELLTGSIPGRSHARQRDLRIGR